MHIRCTLLSYNTITKSLIILILMRPRFLGLKRSPAIASSIPQTAPSVNQPPSFPSLVTPMGTATSERSDVPDGPRRRWSRRQQNRLPDRDRKTSPNDVAPTMSAVRRLLTGAQSESSSKIRATKTLKQTPKTLAPTCPNCVVNATKLISLDEQIVLLRDLSVRCVPEEEDRLEAVAKGDYNCLLRLFQTACDVQTVIGANVSRTSAMCHLRAERLNAMGITLFGQESTVTLISNGAGILLLFQRESVLSLIYEGMQFDLTSGEETSIDLIIKSVLEANLDADTDDLQAILSSVKLAKQPDDADALDDVNLGGLDIPGLRLLRAEVYTTRVLCMMMKTEIYEQGFYRKYVHIDRLGTTFTAVREGETSTLTKINVLPDAMSRPVKHGDDIIGEDVFMSRRKGRKDKFRLSCSVSVNVWEEYESPEWFGYIHPPPNADAMRPANLKELKERLESYGIPDGSEVCRLVYHCLAHKSRNSNVKVDTISAARGYFMYLKNFLKHGTTGTNTNHIIESEELAVVFDGIAFRVSAPQTEIRHMSLFLSLLISDERERNGRAVPKRPVIRRMCSTSEVVLSLCRDITYLNADYDEEGGTLYSASAEEENIAEAWATCMALYVCDGYGCLEGCFNCAIENRRGAIVDEMAVFMNDVQVPVVFDKLYRKNSIAEELSGMSDARGATYPGAFISGRDQCNERTYLAGNSHRFTASSLTGVLQRDLRLKVVIPAGILSRRFSRGTGNSAFYVKQEDLLDLTGSSRAVPSLTLTDMTTVGRNTLAAVGRAV